MEYMPCGELIDVDDFIPPIILQKDDGYRRKIHPSHFLVNVEISNEMAMNRCTYLHLNDPGKYIDCAKKELDDDRTYAINCVNAIVDHVIQRESASRNILWGEHGQPETQVVISSTHLGQNLAQCPTLEMAHPIWEVCYPTIR
jgi:hypothetical protein